MHDIILKFMYEFLLSTIQVIQGKSHLLCVKKREMRR